MPNLSEKSANQAEKSKSYIFFFSKFDAVTLRPKTCQRIEIFIFLTPISMLLWHQLLGVQKYKIGCQNNSCCAETQDMRGLKISFMK